MQNLWQPFSITLDASGSGSFDAGGPSLGYNWIAYICLREAPAGQSVQAVVGGYPLGTGAQYSNAFAVASGQSVTVKVKGGTASSTVTGVITGQVNEGNLAGIPPLPSAGDLITIGAGTVNVDLANVTIVGGQGGQTNISTEVVPKRVGTISVASGAKSGSLALSPPEQGVTALLVAVRLTPAFDYTLTGLSAYGGTSGIDWMIGAPLNLLDIQEPSPFYAEVPGNGEDLTVQVTFGAAFTADTVVADVYALYGNAVAQVVNNRDQPLYVTARGNQGPGGHSLQTVPNAVQWSNGTVLTLTSGSPGELVAPGSGLYVHLWEILIEPQLASTGSVPINLQSSPTFGSGVIAQGNCGYTAPFHMNFGGFALPLGAGLYVTNLSATTAGFDVTVVYSQTAGP